MTMTTYSKSRAKFAQFWDRAVNHREIVRVRRRGQADIMIIAADELEELLETAYLLRSPRNGERLNAALREAREQFPGPMTADELRRKMGFPHESQSD